ncbi:MAG: hypothetical protein ABSB97_03630 [Thermoplasmata archaeon]|jgi:predicted enzyme related to lactoylglutathione lyase
MYQKMGPKDVPRNYINLDRIDVAIRTFMAAVGTPIVGTMEVPGMGRSFIRDDPEGYLLTLWEPEMGRRPHPGARATSRREG